MFKGNILIGKIDKMDIKEIKEILVEILESDEKKEEENKKENNFISQFFIDFFEEIKEFFVGIIDILSLKFLKDFVEEPLTREVLVRRGKKIKGFIWETISTIVFVIVAIIVIRYCLFEMRWIPSASMHPTLIEGDRVIVNKYGSFQKTANRGDIMIFYPPSETLEKTPWKVFSRLTGFFCKDTAYIKRVIGLPGEKIEIKKDNIVGSHQVYINDEPLVESYIKNPLDYTECYDNMYCGPLYLGEDEYFMMGDNRGNSQDSRYWGPLKKDRFIGKATFVIRLSKLK